MARYYKEIDLLIERATCYVARVDEIQLQVDETYDIVLGMQVKMGTIVSYD